VAKSPDKRDLLTTNAAAKIVGVSPRTLENYRIRGGGPPWRKINGYFVRYVLGDLLAWVEVSKKTSTSDSKEDALVELVVSVRPLVIDWRGLKQLGWPNSRAHTWRMMAAGKFPKAHKLGDHFNAHPVWRVAEILAYFEAHGLAVMEDWLSP